MRITPIVLRNLFLAILSFTLALALALRAQTEELANPVDLNTAEVASVFVADDGGLVYLKQQGDIVYWFAEHPGRSYAHVFRGRRDGTHIRGRFISVPKYTSTATGSVTMRIGTGGMLHLDGSQNNLPFTQLEPKSMTEIKDRLPLQTDSGFRAQSSNDTDGSYEDARGRRYYLRTVDDKVIFYVESAFQSGKRPVASYVYWGTRVTASPNFVTGPLVPMPKGQRRAAGNFSMGFNNTPAISGRSDFQHLESVLALPLGQNIPVRLIGENTATTRMVSKRENTLTVEGDIAVAELPTNPQALANVSYALAVADGGRLWPNGEVPYELELNSLVVGLDDSEIELRDRRGTVRTLADAKILTRRRLQSAIDYVNTQTPFRWRPRRAGDNNYVKFQGFEAPCEYLDDEKEQPITCGTSWVGMKGGQQLISFTIPSANAPNLLGKGTFVHEMGHAMGLGHEQNRIDRDNHVRVNWNAIYPHAKGNFEKRTQHHIELGAYDIESIMHYGSRSFSRNGQPTLVPIVEGQRIGPLSDEFSDGDLAALNAMLPTVEEVDAQSRRGHGGGIALTNLDNDAQPEIVLMTYDDAEGENEFKLRICEFSSFYSRATCESSIKLGGLGHRGEGAGIAFGNLDGFQGDDMLVAAYDTGNQVKYRICLNFAEERLGRCFSGRTAIGGQSLGNSIDGLGVAIGDIVPGDEDEVIIGIYDDPEGQNAIKYIVGRNMTNLGDFTWGGPFQEDGLSHRADGFGVALFNTDSNPRPELMFGILDDAQGSDLFKTVTLHNITTNGVSSGSRLDQRFHAHSRVLLQKVTEKRKALPLSSQLRSDPKDLVDE
ncbi:M12 family metallopeptidase [Synechococcus sp. PCC 7335]|uniref:M12 family metallopeptidase n=1 Tax=Synechococcus sp. (strain ATCC 29403 / PCC 7335) TaxID=91464 RepID=UPI00031FEFC0|nr:M12 family metallopeptidase [Synechococcus sp. PCC 7335]